MDNRDYCPFHQMKDSPMCDEENCAIWDEERECCSFKTTTSQVHNCDVKIN